MDTLAALALATDPPSISILDRKPDRKFAPLITLTMWKMIIGQSIFQLGVTLILYFAGPSMLSYQSPREQRQLQTLVFNTFVWMQIFNQYNNRRLDNKLNIFEGLHRNYFFIVIQIIIIAGQIIIVFVGGAAFSTHRLNGAQWGYSVVLGFLSIPVGIMIRLIPDDLIRRLIPSILKRKAKPKIRVSDEERNYQYEWDPSDMEGIRADLTFMKMLRGGRLTALKYKLQHQAQTLLPRSRSGSFRSKSHTDSQPQTPTGESDITLRQTPRTPDSSRRPTTRRSPRSRSNSAYGPAAALAATGIVAGSVAGWSPIGRRSEEGPNRLSHDNRSQIVNEDLIEPYGGTNTNDPAEHSGPSHKAQSQASESTFGPTAGPSSLAPPQAAY